MLLLQDHHTASLQLEEESMCQAFVDMIIDISSDHDATIVQDEEEISQVPPIPDEVLSLNNEELRKRLLDLGEKPGPVTDSTRSAYQIYLSRYCRDHRPQLPRHSTLVRCSYNIAGVLYYYPYYHCRVSI